MTLTPQQSAKLCARIARGSDILATALLDYRDGVLAMTATDYSATIRCESAADGGNTPWQLCVSAAALRDVLAVLDAPALRPEGNGGLRVEQGRIVYRLTGMPAAEYPGLDVAHVPADAPALPDLSPVAVAMLSDESRPALGGVCISPGHAVATDGHRLHVIDCEGIAEPVIVHRAGIEMLSALDGPLRYAMDGRHVGIAGDGCTLTIRRIDEAFPSWQRVVPTPDGEGLDVSVAELADAVRRVAVLSAGKHRLIRCSIADGEMRLSCDDAERGGGVVVLDVGPCAPCELGFAPRYMLDALAAMDVERCRLHMSDQFAPILLAGERVRCVVMPMRL